MLKIVIVEDESFIRKGLVHTIDWLSMGCVVCADAENGQDGLEKILTVLPDVVITDIKMPVMNGLEMVDKALEHTVFKTIILTSYTEFEYAKKAIDLRAYAYLLKPVDEDRIRELMQNVHGDIKKDREMALMLENNKAAVNNSYDINVQLEQTDNFYVAKTLERIRESWQERISIETISDELGVSASYLSRKFKDAVRHTFLDYLNGYRVQKAIQLMNTGKYRICEISDLTGFTDYKHFCSVFKKYTLSSPTKFMKKLKP
ncbi:MAG: response regulator [Clostridiaceae bacterium]|nr:response regulator [Clostridiaceae bacterium]